MYWIRRILARIGEMFDVEESIRRIRSYNKYKVKNATGAKNKKNNIYLSTLYEFPSLKSKKRKR